QGMMFWGFAVSYSGWELNGMPLQSDIRVCANPLAADATIHPCVPEVRSWMSTFSACFPSGRRELKMCTCSRSPGFISRVCAFGVNVAALASCGPAGPVGTPLSWMNAKFVGSIQALLQCVNPIVHSRSLMCSEAHQCRLSHEIASPNGP